MAGEAIGVGTFLERLVSQSARPRYAFMVLSLLAEQADDGGKVGPSIDHGDERLTVRDWISTRMSRMAEGAGKRAAVERRVRAEMGDTLPDDLLLAQAMIDRRVDAQVRQAGADNFSRVLGELETAGYLRRHYAGRITGHQNRGGRRTLVVHLESDVVAAFRRRTALV